jgi:molybdate transport system substrate-binding protein
MSLRILSAGSTLHGLRACADHAARALGMPITIATDHGHNIRDAILRGTAEADVVLLPADMVDTLAGKSLVGESIALGTVGIGGVVRSGAPVPDVSTTERLRLALLAADAVLLTRAPTGEHLISVIAQLELQDTVAAKLRRFDTATKLNFDLASRDGNALGFGPETEIRAGQGVTWIGEVPPEIQLALSYKAAAMTNATQEADAFLAFLAQPSARAALAASGVRLGPACLTKM